MDLKICINGSKTKSNSSKKASSRAVVSLDSAADITVKELISDSEIQARGMKAVADRTPGAGGSVSLMDLSIEAECFGAKKYASPRMKFLPLSGR